MQRLLLAASLGCVMATAMPAQAQMTNCAERDRVVGHLADAFGEARQSIGLSSGNRIVEMFASRETGTWTLTMTMPDGRTCIVGAGQSWERLDEAAIPAGQPT